MDQQEQFVRQLIEFLGFSDYNLDLDREHHHGAAFIHDNPHLIKENLPVLVESINHLLQLFGKKQSIQPIFLDINNYRREREQLIVELARATARKVVATKTEIPLPAMNSYERRLAHMELAAHPDVKTESVGKGKNRYVVIKPIIEGSAPLGEQVSMAS